MIVLAVVIALVSALLVVSWTKSTRDAAYKGATLVRAYVVKKDMPKGTPGEAAISQQYIAATQVPQDFRPGSAIANPDDIKNKVSLYGLAPGQVVVTGMFADPSQAQVTSAEGIEAGQVAVSLSLDQVRAVGGLLTPGDKVDMFVTWGNTGEKTTRLMYQNVRIMAIGQKLAVQAGGDTTATANKQQPAGDSGLITFMVPAEAAQRLIFLVTGVPENNNPIWLALVPPDNAPIERPEVITEGNVLNVTGLTPYPDNK